LNTELGLLIDSPVLAQQLSTFFETGIPKSAYEVRLMNSGNELEWTEQSATGEKRYTADPDSGFFKRARIGFLSILPIEWLL